MGGAADSHFIGSFYISKILNENEMFLWLNNYISKMNES